MTAPSEWAMAMAKKCAIAFSDADRLWNTLEVKIALAIDAARAEGAREMREAALAMVRQVRNDDYYDYTPAACDEIEMQIICALPLPGDAAEAEACYCDKPGCPVSLHLNPEFHKPEPVDERLVAEYERAGICDVGEIPVREPEPTVDPRLIEQAYMEDCWSLQAEAQTANKMPAPKCATCGGSGQHPTEGHYVHGNYIPDPCPECKP